MRTGSPAVAPTAPATSVRGVDRPLRARRPRLRGSPAPGHHRHPVAGPGLRPPRPRHRGLHRRRARGQAHRPARAARRGRPAARRRLAGARGGRLLPGDPGRPDGGAPAACPALQRVPGHRSRGRPHGARGAGGHRRDGTAWDMTFIGFLWSGSSGVLRQHCCGSTFQFFRAGVDLGQDVVNPGEVVEVGASPGPRPLRVVPAVHRPLHHRNRFGQGFLRLGVCVGIDG